jgi:hypothetical protein
VAFADDQPRQLLLDGVPAFDLPWWCGTCPYFFGRLDGADHTLSTDALTDRLTQGLDGIDDDVVATFSAILPEGRYLPLLLTVEPRLTRQGRPGDYFTGEFAATWGEHASTLDTDPETPYYRTFETRVDDDAHLFEFVVPLVRPAWNAMPTVAGHAELLRTTSAPTAVAVSTLDVSRPWVEAAKSSDWFEHWCLTHFLLDGHHKMQAAALTDRPLRLLSLVSLEESPAGDEAVARLPELRLRPRVGR